MTKIAIIGAGGFGREVAMLIEQINSIKKQYEFIGYYDDKLEKGTLVNNFPVLGKVKEINTVKGTLGVIAAIGNPMQKKEVIKYINNKKVKFPTLIHPTALIGNENYVNIGEGSIITAGVIITTNILIGKHVILNLSTTVGHDTSIGNYSSIMPSVNISGEVNIHECVYIGTGAKLINQLTIQKNATIGAGAVVTKNIVDGDTVVGNPARSIKK